LVIPMLCSMISHEFWTCSCYSLTAWTGLDWWWAGARDAIEVDLRGPGSRIRRAIPSCKFIHERRGEGVGREWSGAERAARLLRLREGGSSNGAAMEQRGACAPGPLRRAVALQLAAVSVPGVAEGRLRVRAAGARGGR
jgi:hypothetical protein